ncbi:vacuolar segregation protein pep7 [Rhypophila decipiens]
MATEFIMPRLPDQRQQPHYQPGQFQQASANYTHTPQISPLSTSGNASPTSPSKNHISRQIRPLYMPAVLRPTEFPSKAPAKLKGEEEDQSEEQSLQSNSSFIGLPALGRLSRRSTGDSGKCLDGEWNLDLFPKPTGMPTRKHWKPDQESVVCDHTTCKKYFNYFTRRHHCRKCGNIFCNDHSRFAIPLDQDANYNPRGTPSRACAHCYSQFKEWRSRANSQSSSVDGSVTDAIRTPTVGSPTTTAAAGIRKPNMPTVADVAHSVPRDWNWSTF